MNESLNNIYTRRSVRNFSDKAIQKSDIELLLKAGLSAPTAMNRQTWKFTAIINKDVIAQLATIVGKIIGNDNYKFYGATALIIPSNDVDNMWGREDNACALENIFLAGHSLGIGSVWINQLNGICDNTQLRELLNKIGIPSNHTIYGISALGYAQSEPVATKELVGQFAIIE